MLRFLAPGVLLFAPWAIGLWISGMSPATEVFGTEPLWLLIGLYGAASVWWIALAALDRRRLALRLLLIWVPAVLPTAWLAIAVRAMDRNDSNGLAATVAMWPAILVGIACLLATGLTILSTMDTEPG